MSAQQKKHPFDFKTQYGLGFNPQDDEIVVDFFCGGGGGVIANKRADGLRRRHDRRQFRPGHQLALFLAEFADAVARFAPHAERVIADGPVDGLDDLPTLEEIERRGLFASVMETDEFTLRLPRESRPVVRD